MRCPSRMIVSAVTTLLLASLPRCISAPPKTAALPEERILDQLGCAANKILWFNRFFDITANITATDPFQCNEEEQQGLVDIIQEESLQAVVQLAQQFQNLETEELSGCQDKPLSDIDNEDGRRELLRFGGFVYRGGFRCRFCNSDNSDGSRTARKRKKTIFKDDFEGDTIEGWRNGEIIQGDSSSSNYLGYFKEGQQTFKTFRLPKKTLQAQINVDLYLFGTWRAGKDVVIVTIDGARTGLVDLAPSTSPKYYNSLQSSGLTKVIVGETRELPNGGVVFPVRLFLNDFVFVNDGRVNLGLQFVTEAAQFGIDNVKVSGVIKSSYKASNEERRLGWSSPVMPIERPVESPVESPVDTPSSPSSPVESPVDTPFSPFSPVESPIDTPTSPIMQPFQDPTPVQWSPTPQPVDTLSGRTSIGRSEGGFSYMFLSLRDGLEVTITKLVNERIQLTTSPEGHCLYGKNPEADILLKEKANWAAVDPNCTDASNNIAD